MTATHDLYHRSICGIALACAALMGCNADVESISDLSQPVTVVYTPAQDTWVRRTAGGAVDWGLSQELRTNNVDVAEQREFILLRFPIDLELVCPTLAGATLTLQSAQLAGPLRVYAHRITSGWTPGATGAVPPEPGCPVYSGAPVPFAPPTFLPPSVATIVDDHCPARFTWNVTTMVQAWCNAPGTNFGIRLDGHRPDDLNPEVNFFSMDAVPARRPILEINY